LNPQAEQRQTACMRYISALQRSQITWSARSGTDGEAGAVVGAGSAGRGAVGGNGGSDIGEIIAHA